MTVKTTYHTIFCPQPQVYIMHLLSAR